MAVAMICRRDGCSRNCYFIGGQHEPKRRYRRLCFASRLLLLSPLGGGDPPLDCVFLESPDIA